jgi:hypothetical protein
MAVTAPPPKQPKLASDPSNHRRWRSAQCLKGGFKSRFFWFNFDFNRRALKTKDLKTWDLKARDLKAEDLSTGNLSAGNCKARYRKARYRKAIG